MVRTHPVLSHSVVGSLLEYLSMIVGHDYLGLGGGERGFVLLLDYYRAFHHLFLCRFQVLVVIQGVNSLVLSGMD